MGLIAGVNYTGRSKCNYAIRECYFSQIVSKIWCFLSIINFAQFTVCYNKYEYVCDVIVYSIQGYSTLIKQGPELKTLS